MSSEQDLADFLRSTFRSVWSLETLLLIARDPARCWSRAELVAALRASDVVVSRAIDELTIAALIVPEQDDCVRYAPASEALHSLARAADALYARSPSSVRRLIIGSRQSNLTAFAEAFKFRRRIRDRLFCTLVYLLCFATSGVCALMLGRSYRRSRAPLLLWSAICFVFLAANNLVLVIDLVLLPAGIDLRDPPAAPVLCRDRHLDLRVHLDGGGGMTVPRQTEPPMRQEPAGHRPGSPNHPTTGPRQTRFVFCESPYCPAPARCRA